MRLFLKYFAVFTAGFVTYGILDRVLRAKAEEVFLLGRSQCESTLHEVWKRHDGNMDLGSEDVGRYFIVDWSELSTEQEPLPGDYPLMYDRSLTNHDGRGINILLNDGSVRWDVDAEWLKEFAAEHPNSKLLVPSK